MAPPSPFCLPEGRTYHFLRFESITDRERAGKTCQKLFFRRWFEDAEGVFLEVWLA